MERARVAHYCRDEGGWLRRGVAYFFFRKKSVYASRHHARQCFFRIMIFMSSV